MMGFLFFFFRLMTVFSGKKQTKKILHRIHTLIKDIKRNPFEGIGKPEPSAISPVDRLFAIFYRWIDSRILGTMWN